MCSRRNKAIEQHLKPLFVMCATAGLHWPANEEFAAYQLEDDQGKLTVTCSKFLRPMI